MKEGAATHTRTHLKPVVIVVVLGPQEACGARESCWLVLENRVAAVVKEQRVEQRHGYRPHEDLIATHNAHVRHGITRLVVRRCEAATYKYGGEENDSSVLRCRALDVERGG